MNNNILVRISIAGIVSAVCLIHCQTALSADKAKTSDATPAGYIRPKSSPTNTAARSTNFTSRVHAKIAKDVEPEFLRLIKGRKNTTEDVHIIKRIFREKQLMLEMIEKDLAANYKVRKDRNYSYDVNTMTIYDIALQASGTNAVARAGAATNDNKQVHMVLDSKDKADKFIQMTGARQIATTTIRVLAMLEKEKENELARENSVLMDKFSMSRDRSYEYDPKTGTLYELIPVPATGKNAGK
ncbi:MAG: hypothetical protein WCN95_09205 [bacterium]